VLSSASLPKTKPTAVSSALSKGEGLSGVLTRLAERAIQHIYVDGGITIQRFLAAGLIQRLIITRVPVLIGTGIPLFGAVPRDIVLRHVETRQYTTGLVQSEYEVAT
jgi:dihydrofolate reductase